MGFRRVRLFCATLALTISFLAHAQSSSSTSDAHAPQKQRSASAQAVGHAASSIDDGSVVNSVYRNKAFGFTCKIPVGWVLRTEDMNAPPENEGDEGQPAGGEKTGESQSATPEKKPKDASGAGQNAGGRVLLAAFSRPPGAKGEEINSSIVIVAEPEATYPGLKEAAQYIEPVTEVATAQGFEADEEPYEIAIGAKTLVRGDFHKDVGARVMHQSTLVMLSHGYAVSITVIAGTEDDVEDLVDGLDFQKSAPRPSAKTPK